MNFLITGAAGFIGFHLSKNLLKNKNNKIYGIDNLDSYYSVELKKKRIKLLNKNKNFIFIKKDLDNYNYLNKRFKKIKIDIVFHLAAQAGVRYSLVNPRKYVLKNMFSFFNLLKFIENINTKTIFYASSSSVYGDNKRFPLNEKLDLIPKNIYAFSKISNEITARLFSNLFCKKFIGLRFFTVYGEWGRPDMLIFKYLNIASKKKKFFVNNYGKDFRDFTHINDVIKILKILIKKRRKLKKNEIFNICSNRPINIKKIVKILYNKFPTEVKFVKSNKIEILKTHGDNKKIKKFANFYKFEPFYKNLEKSIIWYEKNKNLF